PSAGEQFAGSSGFYTGRVGLVGVDVHLRKRVCAYPYQRPAEGEAAILVADADVHEVAVLDSEPGGVGRIRMNMPGGNDQPVRGDAAGRADYGHLRRSVQLAAVPHRHVNAEREAVGTRDLDL